MQLWWDLVEKYEESLLNHTTFETDDSIDQFVHIDSPALPKKKKRKDSKKKKES